MTGTQSRFAITARNQRRPAGRASAGGLDTRFDRLDAPAIGARAIGKAAYDTAPSISIPANIQ